jgi:aminoglycoside 6-adenylyltransferase
VLSIQCAASLHLPIKMVAMNADGTIERLTRWAQARNDVRALILTSTRAIPHARVDAYSDYDVIAIVRDVRALLTDTRWQDDFGAVLVAYWDPVATNPATGGEWVGNVTQYENGLKIDFSLWSVQHFTDATAGAEPYAELDAGYQVLLDKDGLTAALPAPTYTAYIPRRPDDATYQRLITDFLVGVPYVAKSLLRDELLPAKWVLDFDMRFNYLLPMVEWRVQCDHDWSRKAGSLGRGLKAQVASDTWRVLESTFTGPEVEANWEALFAMVDLFGRIAAEVAQFLGYRYPETLVLRVTDHARRMRQGLFSGGPLPGDGTV